MGPNYEMDDFKFQLFILCEIPRRPVSSGLASPPFSQIMGVLVYSTLSSLTKKLVNFYTDVKNYPSFMYLYKSIQEKRSLNGDPLRDLRVLNSHFEKPQIY